MAIDRVKTKASAEKFLKANRIPEAIRELQKLADDNPRDIQVLNQIGQLHLRQGNKDLAVPCFIKVADLFTKQGFFTKAVASLKIVTRESPENLAAWEMLASLSEQQGFAREAWGAYEKVAELYTKKGNLNGVIDVQKKLLELEPDNLKVQVQLGDNLVKGGRRDEGVKHYLKAGGKLIAQGHVKEAARMYERALQLDPTNFNALEAAVKTHLAHKQADVALQLLDSLLERAPGAEGILLLKADILNETREFAAAEAVCRGVMGASASSSGAMFRLVRALVMQDRFDDASTAVGDWLKACGPAKVAEAEALYEEILRFKAGHVLSLKGLVEAARLSGNKERHVQALTALAESASAQGPLPLARQTLQELVSLAPNNLQLAEKLHAVEAKLGAAPAPKAVPVPPPAAPPAPPPVQAPAEPKAAAVPPPASPKTPLPPPETDVDIDVVVEETGEADIDIDMDDLHLEHGEMTSSLSNVPAARDEAPAAPEVEEPTLEERAPAVVPQAPAPSAPAPKATLSAREADDIRDQLTEAEVFLKYGLVEKAIGELQSVLKKVPDHIHAHQKLIAIYRNQKKGDKLLRQLLKLAAIFREQGDEDTCVSLLDEARAIDPNHKALAEWDQAASAGPSTPGRPTKSAGALPDLMVELEMPAAGEAKASPPADDTGEVVLAMEEPATPQVSFGELDAVPEEVSLPEPAEPAFPMAEDEASLDLGLDRALQEQLPSPAASEAELAELLEEAEFYLNQELFGEAQRALKGLEARWPEDDRVVAFRTKLSKKVVLSPEDTQPPIPAAAVLPPEPSTEPELVFEEPTPSASFAKAEPEEPTQDEIIPAVEATAPSKPAEAAIEESRDTTSTRSKTKMKVSVRDLLPEEEPKAEEALFKEDEYYDLASELGAALDGLQAPEEALFDEEGKSPEEMSFEEVFEEFKKGVEKKVGEEDYATHYNLGIAYKEMELLDEAIGEFQLAARAPQFFVECCSMLGICFRQKGLTELAEKWYRKGIAAPGFAEDVYVGLKYDLADCLEEQGRNDEARDIFKEVYAVQMNYRDVKDRVKKLG